MIYEITTLELVCLTVGALIVGCVIGFIRSAVKVLVTARKFTVDDVIPSHLIVHALVVAREVHRNNLTRESKVEARRPYIGTIEVEEEK